MNGLAVLADSGDGIMAAIAGMGALVWIAAIAVSVLTVVAQWKIFTKAGEAGWKSLIPYYGTWVYYRIVTGSGAKMFMLLIPVFGEIYAIITQVKLCRAFGKSGGFCVGMVFLSPIFMIILGFDKSQYIGPQ